MGEAELLGAGMGHHLWPVVIKNLGGVVVDGAEAPVGDGKSCCGVAQAGQNADRLGGEAPEYKRIQKLSKNPKISKNLKKSFFFSKNMKF